MALDPETRARFDRLDQLRHEAEERLRSRREELERLKADFKRVAEEFQNQGRRRRGDDVPA